MKIHYLQHAPFEKLDAIKEWVAQKGYDLSCTHTYRSDPLPALNDFDFLIIMGGPQNLNEIEQYPYLAIEIELVKQAIQAKKLVLGICLGAQMIGEALGAKTQPSPNKEVGVFPVALTSAALSDPMLKSFPQQFDALHWHYYMPGLPQGAELLAYSAGCPNQMFRYGEHVYAVQFHMEMTSSNVSSLIENCAKDLDPGPHTMSKEDLLACDIQSINQRMHALLELLTASYLIETISVSA
jgi:GMP synthase (glutamine-hydrolysing)